MDAVRPPRTPLLGLDREAVRAWCADRGQKPFRADQLLRWIHRRGASDWSTMTDLAKPFRELLEREAELRAPDIISDHVARDGTRKWLLDVGQGNAVEMVYIPEANRGTLCVSSQAGCAVNCRFCSTGHQGFSRNLATAEIVAQPWLANRLLSAPGAIRRTRSSEGAGEDEPQAPQPVTNVVFMGMGEPLLNYDAVLPAVRLLLDDHAYGLSRRRVTVSTSGVVPMMDRLGRDCPVALAVSLHAPNDALRDELVPLNRKYPLAELMAACRRYLEVAPRDFITFEYVMLDGVNDRPEHARELIDRVRDVPCKLNLIPFNPFAKSGLRRSADDTIARFAGQLESAGIVTTVRRTRGDDIDAACGQLAGEVVDRTRARDRRAALREAPVQWSASSRTPLESYR